MRWQRYWPVVAAIVVSLIVYKFPAEVPDTNFYGIVAQVIPVLIVAVALDGRGQDMWDRTPSEYRWQITVGLLGAQIAALLVIAGTVDSGNVTAAICTVGLVGGFLAVAIIVLLEREDLETLSSRREERARRRRSRHRTRGRPR